MAESDIDRLNKAVSEVMERPLSEAELAGFGKIEPADALDGKTCPYVSIERRGGRKVKDMAVTIGIKGTF